MGRHDKGVLLLNPFRHRNNKGQFIELPLIVSNSESEPQPAVESELQGRAEL